MRWSRPYLARSKDVVQAASGHVGGSFESLAGVAIAAEADLERTRPLEQLATLLYDPKRVRASCDGVELATLRAAVLVSTPPSSPSRAR